MHVHFASGEHPFPAPWWNVDFHAGDQQADLLSDLPSNLTGIRYAYVGHFLEHLTIDEGVLFLTRVRVRMARRGRLVIIGPDAVKGQRFHERGLISTELLYAIRAHGKRQGPDGIDRSHCHLWNCNGDDVVSQAKAAGWTDVTEFPINELPTRFPEVPVISLAGWQFAVSADA